MRHFLAATDFSDFSRPALDATSRLATAFAAKITLAHVYDPLPLSPAIAYPAQVWTGADVGAQLAREADKLLHETKLRLLADVADVDTLSLRHTSASTAICQAAADLGVDAVVVGCHGRTGVTRLLLGSVAEQTLRHAPCSVVIGRAIGADFPRRIVVTTDFSDNALAGVRRANEVATATGATVTLLHVVETPSHSPKPRPMADIEPELLAALHRLASDELVGAPNIALYNAPAAAPRILEVLDTGDFDLVVMAATGRTALSRLLVGSVAEKVARHAPCSVWIHR